MRKHIERSVAFLSVLALCLSCAVAARTERIFGDSFVATCDLPHADIYNGVSLTVVDNTAFHLMRSGDIYAWNPDQDMYSFYVHVSACPLINVEIPFSRQSESVRTELTEAVSCLIPADEGLYGFNDISGMIGLIDKEGWHVNDVRLVTSALRLSDDDYPEALRNAFIEDGNLYAFHDINLTLPAKPQTTLLVFNLLHGDYSATKLPDTITFCRYTSGKLLCIQDSGTQTPTLAVYDIASHQLTALDMAVPISIERKIFAESWYLHCEIGGLAYDEAHDIVYLADAEGLWRSIAGAPFERAPMKDAWESMFGTAEALVLSSGGYVTQNGWPYYVNP